MKKILLITFTFLLIAIVAYESKQNTATEQVPILSLTKYNDTTTRKEFVNEMGNAFHKHGFIVITDINIDCELLNNVHKASRQFFAQEQKTKTALQKKSNSGERGYVTSETPKMQPLDVVDHKEIYHIGPELNAEKMAIYNYEPNLWPNDAFFQKTMIAFYQEMEKTMVPISQAAAEYMNLRRDTFSSMMAEGEHLLRALHYFKNPKADLTWAAEHTDMNFITLIPGGAAEGLQVKMSDGSWVDVKVAPNSVVVNVGDSLEHLTNGYYKSGIHRVVAKKGIVPERWSIVFHGHVRHDLDMTPLKRGIELSGNIQKYPNAKGWELLYTQIAAVGRASPEMLDRIEASGIIERQLEYGQASDKVIKLLEKNRNQTSFHRSACADY